IGRRFAARKTGATAGGMMRVSLAAIALAALVVTGARAQVPETTVPPEAAPNVPQPAAPSEASPSANAEQNVAMAPSEEKLKVCADPNNLPFSNREREGFENRLAEVWARQLGRELEDRKSVVEGRCA